MAAIVKCALKLFSITFVSTENQDKIASVLTSYVAEIS